MTTRLQALRDEAIAAGRLADSWDAAADHRAAAEAYRRAEAEGNATGADTAWQDAEWAAYHETKMRTAADQEEKYRPVDGRHWCCICGQLSDHFTGFCGRSAS